MKCNKWIIFLVPISFSSCFYLPIHRPPTPALPILDQNSVISIEGTATTNGLDLKPTVRIGKKLMVTTTGNVFSRKMYYGEAAAGVHFQINKVHLELLSGFGHGTSDFTSSMAGMSDGLYGYGKYNEVYIQPVIAIGNTDNPNKVGFTVKLSSVDFAVTSMNRWRMRPGMKLNHYYPGSANQLTLFYRRYSTFSGFMTTIYLSHYSFRASLPFDLHEISTGSSLGIGIGYNFHRRKSRNEDAIVPAY